MFPHYVKAHKAAEERRPGCVLGDGGGGGGGSGRQWSREGETLVLRWSVSHSLFLLPFIHANKQWQTQSLDTHTHTRSHKRVAKTPCHHILKPSKCACQKGSWLTAVLSPPGGSRGQACLSQGRKEEQQRGSKFDKVTDVHSYTTVRC